MDTPQFRQPRPPKRPRRPFSWMYEERSLAKLDTIPIKGFPEAGAPVQVASRAKLSLLISGNYVYSLFMHHFPMFKHHICSLDILGTEGMYKIMRLPSKEAVGVRYTGWAALGRDPQEDTLEYTCPYCGEHGVKAARRTPDQYHFTHGFLED